MIYDCFTFFNELDLLEIRLNILNEHVDRFILVESTCTHAGRSKPLYYKENEARYAAFKDKIIHIVVDDFSALRESASPMEQAWARENIQRNAIMKGLAAAKPDDLVIISDLDEIPNLKAARGFMANPVDVARFEQDCCCYFLNMFNCAEKAMRAGSIILTRKIMDDEGACGRPDICSDGVVPYVNEGLTITKWRRYIRKETVLKKGGWHFTYLGGIDAVAAKLKSIAEGGLVTNVQDLRAYAQARIERGEDILRRGDRMVARKIDGTFPQYIQNNQQKYAQLVFPVTPEYLKRVRWLPLQAWFATRPRAIVLSLIPGFACALIRKVLKRRR